MPHMLEAWAVHSATPDDEFADHARDPESIAAVLHPKPYLTVKNLLVL